MAKIKIEIIDDPGVFLLMAIAIKNYYYNKPDDDLLTDKGRENLFNIAQSICDQVGLKVKNKDYEDPD